jgi:hypothetical protein
MKIPIARSGMFEIRDGLITLAAWGVPLCE